MVESVSTAAAAFTNMPITLHIEDAADATKFVDLPFNLTVNANLTITVTGLPAVGTVTLADGTKYTLDHGAVADIHDGQVKAKDLGRTDKVP